MGAITSSSVAALGSGYSGGDQLTVVGGGSNASVVINFVDGSGIPTSYSLPDQGFNAGGNPGCGYRVASTVPTTGGSGSGFKINILAVGPGTDATHGAIGSSEVVSGGSGYVLNDTGFIVQGANSSAHYGEIGVSGGAITSFNQTGADGYHIGPATTLAGGEQPGSGSGFTINILTIVPCSGGVLSGYRNRFYVAK